jgi:hypothetical protein
MGHAPQRERRINLELRKSGIRESGVFALPEFLISRCKWGWPARSLMAPYWPEFTRWNTALKTVPTSASCSLWAYSRFRVSSVDAGVDRVQAPYWPEFTRWNTALKTVPTSASCSLRALSLSIN